MSIKERALAAAAEEKAAKEAERLASVERWRTNAARACREWFTALGAPDTEVSVKDRYAPQGWFEADFVMEGYHGKWSDDAWIFGGERGQPGARFYWWTRTTNGGQSISSGHVFYDLLTLAKAIEQADKAFDSGRDTTWEKP